jgi:hypothetical protein
MSGWGSCIFAACVCAGVVIIIALAILAIRAARARRAEFAALQRDIKKLSEDTKYLVDAEHRRFLQSLRSPKNDDDESKVASSNLPPNEGDSALTLVSRRDRE